MKIGLISDTHGSTTAVRKVIEAAGPVDLWLHAGDYYWDGAVLEDLTHTQVVSVLGNCDGTSGRKLDEFIPVQGKNIWLTHGHHHRVKNGTEELRWWCSQYQADICVFGHTHMPLIEQHSECLIINPGSPFLPRGGNHPSFATLEIDPNGHALAQIIVLTGS